jgi:hypothetical protein
VAYRDDRQALELRVAELEHDNEKLRRELEGAKAKLADERAQSRERRRASSAGVCPACGGSLLPAAVFAGSNNRNPVPLRMSTLRFGDPAGGFTNSAPIQAKVCGSCGFIHHYIDLASAAADPVTQEIPLHLERARVERAHEGDGGPDDESGGETR